jgi:hypothetical protein
MVSSKARSIASFVSTFIFAFIIIIIGISVDTHNQYNNKLKSPSNFPLFAKQYETAVYISTTTTTTATSSSFSPYFFFYWFSSIITFFYKWNCNYYSTPTTIITVITNGTPL